MPNEHANASPTWLLEHDLLAAIHYTALSALRALSARKAQVIVRVAGLSKKVCVPVSDVNYKTQSSQLIVIHKNINYLYRENWTGVVQK